MQAGCAGRDEAMMLEKVPRMVSSFLHFSRAQDYGGFLLAFSSLSACATLFSSSSAFFSPPLGLFRVANHRLLEQTPATG